MEELPLFVLAIIFGGFFLFFIILCIIRLFVFLTDDKRFLCFKSKAALQRRRIQLSLLPEMTYQRPETVGYMAGQDENIDEFTICQPYVYEDGRSTGMRMIANLPIAIAFTTHSADSIFGVYPPYPMSPNLSQHLESRHFLHYEDPPPPNYNEVNFNHFQNCQKKIEYIEMQEPPPPTYDECMMKPNNPNIISNNENERCQTNDASN